jgi:hypothetical protein
MEGTSYKSLEGGTRGRAGQDGFRPTKGQRKRPEPAKAQRALTMNDRRSIGRTKIAKGALLFFKGKTGVLSCGVIDITNVGAGIRTHDLPVVPLNFELSFDNFRTIRKCRLIWREGDFVGVAFES